MDNLTDNFYNLGTFGAICIVIVSVCGVILYFREPIKILLQSWTSKKSDKSPDDDIMNNIDKLKSILEGKITTDDISVAEFSDLFKSISRDLVDISKNVSDMATRLNACSSRNVLVDDHVNKILDKLDKFNDTLIGISTKIDYMSKGSAGF